MKKMIYKYLMILIILATGIIYIIASKYEIEDETGTQIIDNVFRQDGSQLIEKKDSIHISEIIKTDTKYPLNVIYKVENEKANLYFLSYRKHKLDVGSLLKLKKENEYVSEQLYLLFRETYPNVSLKDMGVNSTEEAYQATQLALWELAMRTGDVQEYCELSLIDSIKEDIGLKNINVNVFREAKNLVNFVENYSYKNNTEIQLVPKLILENDKVRKEPISKQNDIIIGPYSYKVQAGILTNVEIDITDQDGNDICGQITDVNGTEIKNLIEQKEFYVKVPNTCDKVKGDIKVDVKRLIPRIYSDKNSDYVVNTYQSNTMEEEFKINIDRK